MNERRHLLLKIIVRVAAYALGLLLTMWAAQAWFYDTYTANLCLFALFSFTFELLSGPYVTKGFSWRRFFYTACVLLASAVGLLMFLQAISCQH